MGLRSAHNLSQLLLGKGKTRADLYRQLRLQVQVIGQVLQVCMQGSGEMSSQCTQPLLTAFMLLRTAGSIMKHACNSEMCYTH